MAEAPQTRSASHYYLTPAARRLTIPSSVISSREMLRASMFFHARADLSPTPLHHLPALGASLGVDRLLVKDETRRFGLNAFKILGVTYAFEQLRSQGRLSAGTVVACASAGNHGHAVARLAHLHACAARIYLPAATDPARIRAIAAEGADVVVTDCGYDEAVRRLIRDAEREGWLVVSDTSWTGYEQIPKWIMAGYTRIMEEAEEAWAVEGPPTVVFVQAGVGGLACAVARWLSDRFGTEGPRVIVCEPEAAPCLTESARRGQPTMMTSSATVMECLRCDAMSPVVWPSIAHEVDAFVTVSEAGVRSAVERLRHPLEHDPRIEAGYSGACGIAALDAVLRDEALMPVRRACVPSGARVMAIVTEGPADPGC